MERKHPKKPASPEYALFSLLMFELDVSRFVIGLVQHSLNALGILTHPRTDGVKTSRGTPCWAKWICGRCASRYSSAVVMTSTVSVSFNDRVVELHFDRNEERDHDCKGHRHIGIDICLIALCCVQMIWLWRCFSLSARWNTQTSGSISESTC